MRNFIVLDLEWNQGSEGKQKENNALPFEIVEIGAVKLDQNKNIIDSYSQLIKPQVYLQIHYMTQKIVHLNMDELEEGKEFPAVFSEFMEWCGDDYIFCTWGSLDLMELQRNMQFYDLEPLSHGPLKYLDIQKLFSIAYEDEKTRRTLEYAVDYLAIDKKEDFHRALSDAYYTSRIYQQINDPHVESHVSFDIFHTPVDRENEIHVVFDKYSKYISREFKDKNVAISDREVASTRCYKCGKNARKKVRWFSVNGKHYYCLSYCNEHGYIKGKARMKHAESGNVYVVKTLKLISESEAQKIIEKKERLRIQRKKKRREKKDSW